MNFKNSDRGSFAASLCMSKNKAIITKR